MIKAIVFDCFGVLVIDSPTGSVKNRPLLEMINDLKADYEIGLLSNVVSGDLSHRFSTDELALFGAVVASGDIGYAKPDAQAYEYVADRLGVRLDECVMIDDREDYCEGAMRTGMRAIRYENLQQMQEALRMVLHA